jgi:DNA (cytosine-5)-methyltransferase 1
MVKDLTVISTFAGGGGSSLGYNLAGYKELLAIEWDSNAAECLKANFPGLPVFQQDIKKITSKKILDFTGLAPGELDLLDGSPPCQGFSTTGKRDHKDQRNNLFIEFVRLLKDLQPRSFLMENVSGMIIGANKKTYLLCVDELRQTGYVIKSGLYNTKYFGVPQSRERLIIIGIRKDLNITPTLIENKTKPITVKNAFKGLDDNSGIEFPDWLKKATLEMIPGNFGKEHVEKAFIKYRGNPNGARSFKLLAWDKPSCTVTKTWILPSGIAHPDKQRYINISEIKRLCSFPDNYKLPGKFTDQLARMGNCVPPLFAKHLAEHIKNLLS